VEIKQEQNQVLLPLDGQRLVTFKDHGQPLTFFFRRITEADWKKYFNGASVETAKDGDEQVTTVEYQVARIALVEEALEKVEGYKLRGGEDLMSITNWKQRIPIGHKIQAGGILEGVSPSLVSESGFFIDPELDEVEVDASWGSVAPGSMSYYKNLKHRFTPAKPEHQKKFFRVQSESRVIVGGDRKGRTLYGKHEPALIEIYNELIADVDGYSVGGTSLSGRGGKVISAEMDSGHKVVAVRQLFAIPPVAGEGAVAA
jgi:hypothetical protein